MEKRGENFFSGFFARHKTAMATATLMGTIIGAGILGIPYVVAASGFIYGLLLLVVLGTAFIFVNLFLGEIVLRTKEQHQLPGYAGRYLGIWGKRLMTFSLFIGLYGALTAYLIGEGSTMHSLFGAGSPLLYTLGFFLVVSFIIIKGIKATGKAEFILISLLFAVVLLIGLLSYRQISFPNLATHDFSKIFLPYGVILFAYIGMPAIPEMQEVLGKRRQSMKKALILGTLLPIILYLTFTIIIVGIISLGQFEALAPNERIATIALSIYSSPLLGMIANILAILAMFTSFLTIGIALTEIYQYDYGFPRPVSLLLTLLIPLGIATLNLTTFIAVLGITGAVGGGLDGILITLMYWKAKHRGNRRPEYKLPRHLALGIILIIMFMSGIAYQLWRSFLS